MRKNLLQGLLLLAAFVAIAAAVSLLIPNRPPVAPRAIPAVNGYDTLLSASHDVGRGINVSKMTAEELRVTVEFHSNALHQARAGLQLESCVPVQFTRSYFSNHVHQISGFRNLAQLFVAEGQLAEMDGRTSDAADSYLDAVALGLAVSRGGTLIDSMIGTAIQNLGLPRLKLLADRLDAAASRRTMTRLEVLDSGVEDWQQVMAREKEAMAHYPATFQERVSSIIQSGNDAHYVKAEKRFNEQQTERRRLLLQLAVRTYELEKGARPTSVAPLVPDYLKAIPQDPITGTNLTYLP